MTFQAFKEQFHILLDRQQETAVQTVDGPILLLAVPGSGKTTVLVSRIGYMLHVRHIQPEQILTMTYSVAAARDMRVRYASYFGEEEAARLEFRTINSICARIIRLYERRLGRTAFRLLDDGAQKNAILSELYRRQTDEFATESTLKAIETAITYAKNQMLKGEALAQIEVEGCDFAVLYQEYCALMRKRQLMDFDDQMVYALQILRRYPQLLELLQSRYQYFCVDEAQDTSKIQHTIIRFLASQSRNLFMVGDEDQSIYGFRAAYPQALTEFGQIYPDATVLYMEQNYRSTEQIVAAADQFIQRNKLRHPKHMKATQGSGPAVERIQVYDRIKQYRWLADLAAHCEEQTAILYRDNDSALPIIDLLSRAGVPYRCRQVESVFFSNRVVRDIVDIIRFAMYPRDGDCFMSIYYKLGAGISKAAAQIAAANAERADADILEYISEFSNVSNWTKARCKALRTHMANMLTEQADSAVYRIVNYMGYGEYLASRGMDAGKADILQALGVDQPSPEALLDRLEELNSIVQDGSTGPADCPLILSTIHSSKGLEYDRVILADVMDGIFPRVVPEQNMTEEETATWEEERRLFYVGMTRARKKLSLITFKREGQQSCFAEELLPKPAPKRRSKKGAAISAPQLAALTRGYVPRALVNHQNFGPGVVGERSGDYVTIRFDSGEIKKFSLTATIQKGLMSLE